MLKSFSLLKKTLSSLLCIIFPCAREVGCPAKTTSANLQMNTRAKSLARRWSGLIHAQGDLQPAKLSKAPYHDYFYDHDKQATNMTIKTHTQGQPGMQQYIAMHSIHLLCIIEIMSYS